MFAIQNVKTGKFLYGKDYRIVVLKTVEVKRVIDFDCPGGYDGINDDDWNEEEAEC